MIKDIEFEQDCCGGCVYFQWEYIDGFGFCTYNDKEIEKYCGQNSCANYFPEETEYIL